MNSAYFPWVQKGYSVFANEGPLGLKVERLSKEVGKNKSSFYHHFADLEGFIEVLLAYHIDQAKLVALKEAKCETREAYIAIILDAKEDLLFSRQLRINRDNPDFESCFCRTNEISTPAILNIWSEIIGLKENSYLAGLVLQLSLENFYLQITEETLTEKWLNSYFDQLVLLVKEFRKTGTITSLNASV